MSVSASYEDAGRDGPTALSFSSLHSVEPSGFRAGDPIAIAPGSFGSCTITALLSFQCGLLLNTPLCGQYAKQCFARGAAIRQLLSADDKHSDGPQSPPAHAQTLAFLAECLMLKAIQHRRGRIASWSLRKLARFRAFICRPDVVILAYASHQAYGAPSLPSGGTKCSRALVPAHAGIDGTANPDDAALPQNWRMYVQALAMNISSLVPPTPWQVTT